LEEEADLATSAGGKLRSSILKGANSNEIMAAVRAMAFMCDAVLWPLLRAVKPTADKHVFDVLPHVWPAAINFFKAAAAAPEKVIDGSLSIDLGANAAPHPASTTEGQLKRSARARKDMERIRAAATGDELVAKLLTAAFEAMIPGTENHAAEYVGNGKCALANITPELRATFDAMLSTSTSVERLHALWARQATRGRGSSVATRVRALC